MAQLKTMLIAVLCFAAAGTTAADDLADKRAAYVTAGKVECSKRIDGLKQQIAKDRQSLVLAKRYAEDGGTPPAFFARRIAINTAAVKGLEKSRFLPPRIGANSMRVGQVGVLALNDGGPQDDLVEWVEVIQVLDAESMLVKIGSKTIAWMSVNTAGITDGKKYPIRGSYEVTGPRRYATPIGATNTVFELAEFNPGPLP